MWRFLRAERAKFLSCLSLFEKQGSKKHASSVKVAYSVYESAGTNQNLPPLIIMHGLLASRNLWPETATRLESQLKRKVYSIDLRNHGDSPHTNAHTYRHMADDLRRFMAENRISKAMLLGDGMGGRVAIYFALKHPQAVERGVILDVAPLSVPRGMKQKKLALFAMKTAAADSDVAGDRAEIQRIIENVVKRPELVDFVMSNLRVRANGEFYWTVNVKALMDNLRSLSNFSFSIKRMQPFQGPMLFLCGNYSEFITPRTWPMVSVLFPNATIEWLNVSHLIYIDQSEYFFNLVINFLKNNLIQ